MSGTSGDAGRRVDKPWGHELIWAETDRYVGKVLHVNAGQRLSLQYHVKKDETIHLWSGRLQLIVDEGSGLTEREMAQGESYHIRPGTKHRVGAAAEIAFQPSSRGLYHQERVAQSHECSVNLRLLGRKRCARGGSNDLGVGCGRQKQQGEQEGFTGHDSIPTSM